MLSGEKGDENGEKNNNGSNQQKSNFARVAHFFCTFLCRCFARLKTKTSRNVLVTRFMKEMSCVFLLPFFSLSLIFTMVVAFLTFSPPLQNFMLFLRQIMPPMFFLSFSLSFAGLSPYFLFFSVLLFVYFPNLWTGQLI